MKNLRIKTGTDLFFAPKAWLQIATADFFILIMFRGKAIFAAAEQNTQVRYV